MKRKYGQKTFRKLEKRDKKDIQASNWATTAGSKVKMKASKSKFKKVKVDLAVTRDK